MKDEGNHDPPSLKLRRTGWGFDVVDGVDMIEGFDFTLGVW
jgi:hypothetical protein